MPDALPAWAQYVGDGFDEDYIRWSTTPCARQGCGVPRWAHRANALALARGAKDRYWQTCGGFVEPPNGGVPVAVVPYEPSTPSRVAFADGRPQ